MGTCQQWGQPHYKVEVFATKYQSRAADQMTLILRSDDSDIEMKPLILTCLDPHTACNLDTSLVLLSDSQENALVFIFTSNSDT